ncbi:MAG: peptidylprolyl isomerase [Ruminococcaceae bacterium]|nr:peptidylprolyl isomerase [Oscillospiraceae bacterium]
MEKVKEQIGAYEYTDFVKNEGPTDFVVIKVKDYGDIVIALRSDVAPITADNFKQLVSQGFYKNYIFHRVIKDFMIQGGGIKANGTSQTTDAISGEFTSNGFLNTLTHEAGVISMARTNEPDSASSQFFIMHGKAEHLDGDYAAFGYVVAGMDVVDAIAKCEVDNPLSSFPMPIDKVEIEDVFFVSPIADTGLAAEIVVTE